MKKNSIELKMTDAELKIIIKIVSMVLKALKAFVEHRKAKGSVDLLSINQELEDAHGDSNFKA